MTKYQGYWALASLFYMSASLSYTGGVVNLFTAGLFVLGIVFFGRGCWMWIVSKRLDRGVKRFLSVDETPDEGHRGRGI